ncbi:hypothetical protein FALBO_4993 [Fusarium albosuccineum]|uniref:RING-type domain-containing protein n=1 Tax=Fusarium albosuccineum TaxID=1237068 RepID=A0A8H4LI77_9HYPO|nr:hypothetical protein FALBO_4993 [Fusarium albosuccineum]
MPITLRSGRDYDGRGCQLAMDLDAQAKEDANNPPAEAAAETEETQDSNPPAEEHFWPTLRKHALGKADPSERPVKGTCPICYIDLSIAGLPPPADGGKPAVIAPCGHVMCRYCWPKKQ